MTKLKRYTISLLLTLTTLVLSSCHSYKTLNTDTVFPVESFAYIQVKVKYKAQQCIPPEGEKKCSYDIAELPVLTAAGSGSGAVVRVQKNGTYVLTAAHVCREELDKKVRMPDGSVVIAKGTIQINTIDYYGITRASKEIAIDKEADLCILKTNPGWGEAITLASRPPDISDPVYNIAAPLGIFMPGMVLTFEGRYTGRYKKNMYFTLPVRPGSSGSCVMNEDGEIVSMIHSAFVRLEHVGIGTDFYDILAIMSTIPSDDVETPTYDRFFR